MTHPTHAQILALARNAGAILREHYEKGFEIGYKGVIDVVTEVDRLSEAYLLGEIQRFFPDHQIYAEESGQHDGHADHTWYIDPLDGTVNYAHGVPMFSVSIAYAYKGNTLLGAVYDPMRDELFHAERGQGAFLNDRRLKVTDTPDLVRSLLVTGFPYDAWNTPHDNFDNFVRLARLTQGVRRLGSAALDAAYVGAGRFDGFWELSLRPYDIAAGGLIAEEAGAKVTNIHGDPDYIHPPQSVVAANPALHPKIMLALQQAKTNNLK